MDWYRLLPQFWIQNNPTSLMWDAALNDLLDKHEPILDARGFVCQIGPAIVWIENWPYAYGRLYSPDMRMLPRVSTRFRLRREIETACLRKMAEPPK